MASGRIALVGDAAHPMRPYLAQGASMALEDAQALGRCLGAVRDRGVDVETALHRYALERWQRVARVQRRARRNGTIFHATGLLRLARDLAMRSAGGTRVMDLPWLYRR
jgi:salicylate hydroxylase